MPHAKYILQPANRLSGNEHTIQQEDGLRNWKTTKNKEDHTNENITQTLFGIDCMPDVNRL